MQTCMFAEASTGVQRARHPSKVTSFAEEVAAGSVPPGPWRQASEEAGCFTQPKNNPSGSRVIIFSASVPTHLRVLGGERLEQQDGVVVIVNARVDCLAARYRLLLLGGRRSPRAELVRQMRLLWREQHHTHASHPQHPEGRLIL